MDWFMDLFVVGLLFVMLWGVPFAIVVALVIAIYKWMTKGHEREDLSRMSHEHHLEDEVRAFADTRDQEAFDRLVEKFGYKQVSNAVGDVVQEARERVRNGLAVSYMWYKKGRVPEEQCEGGLKDAYNQLEDKGDLIPSLNMPSEEQGASYYKSLFLKFLEKDNIRL